MNKINKFIEDDLSKYSISNMPPKSFTVNAYKKDFRHYEFAKDYIFGLVAFDDDEDGKGHIVISLILEDDGYFYTSKNQFICDSHHTENIGELFIKMNEWLVQNCIRGKYVCGDTEWGECGFRKMKPLNLNNL